MYGTGDAGGGSELRAAAAAACLLCSAAARLRAAAAARVYAAAAARLRAAATARLRAAAAVRAAAAAAAAHRRGGAVARAQRLCKPPRPSRLHVLFPSHAQQYPDPFDVLLPCCRLALSESCNLHPASLDASSLSPYERGGRGVSEGRDAGHDDVRRARRPGLRRRGQRPLPGPPAPSPPPSPPPFVQGLFLDFSRVRGSPRFLP